MRKPRYGDRTYNSASWQVLRLKVLIRDNYQCQLRGSRCRGTATMVDHWIPLCKGGSNAMSNLRAACKPCNTQKKDRLPLPFTTVNW